MSPAGSPVVEAAPLSPAVVRAVLANLKARGRGPGVVALRGRPQWEAPDGLEMDGQRVRVSPCVSSLAVREALIDHEPGSWLVVITDRDENDLGLELRSRLVKQRIIVPELWEVVRDRFQARALDQALVRESSALAEALIAEAPLQGWPPARGGVLTRDGAMEALASQALGLGSDRIDAPGLFEWTLDRRFAPGLAGLAQPVQEAVLSWLAQRTGNGGRHTIEAIRAGHGRDSLPLALVAGLLSTANLDTGRAGEVRGLLGHRYGGRTPSGDSVVPWTEAAQGLVERHLDADSRYRGTLGRAEWILSSVEAVELADRSPVLPRGFDHRLRCFAQAVRVAIDGPLDDARLASVEQAHLELARHLLFGRDRLRSERSRMALRLVRWLALDDVQPSTMAEAIERHLGSDGWVDRARASIWRGDEDHMVAAAYGELYRVVCNRRTEHDHGFATILAAYTAANDSGDRLLHVEDAVRRVALPLAARAGGVLLVLVDGMGVAVATELGEGFLREGWHEVIPSTDTFIGGTLAALPTVTEVCRTSLFSGALRKGGQQEERSGLERLAAGAGIRALLFHKSDLETSAPGESLPGQVREAVEDSDIGLVAVVLNTVDDALSTGDVAGTTWDIDSVKHLRPLLHAARYAGRSILLTSDHGHVLDRRDGELRAHQGASARWRPAGAGASRPAADEVLLDGRRVVGGPVIAPWRELVRYAPARSGYHGGISQAEVVNPLLVCSPEIPQAWEVASPRAPRWWSDSVQVGMDQAPQIAMPESRPDLATAVVASPAYAIQRERARRTALPEEKVVAIVRALLEARGRLHQDAIATVAGIPIQRLAGVMTVLQRLLNVDGYEVIGRDADGVTVILDERLLREQFALDADL